MTLLLSGPKVLSLYLPRSPSDPPWTILYPPLLLPYSLSKSSYSISSSGSRESSIFTASPASNASCVSVSLLQILILFRLGEILFWSYLVGCVSAWSTMCVVLWGGDWRVCMCVCRVCARGGQKSASGVLILSPPLFLRNSLSLNLELTHSAGLSHQQTQGSCYCCHPALEIMVQCHDAWLLCEFCTSELRSSCLYHKLFPHCAIFPSSENHCRRRLSQVNPRWTSGSYVLAMGKGGSLFLVCADHCLAWNTFQRLYLHIGTRPPSCVERRATPMRGDRRLVSLLVTHGCLCLWA